MVTFFHDECLPLASMRDCDFSDFHGVVYHVIYRGAAMLLWQSESVYERYVASSIFNVFVGDAGSTAWYKTTE